LTLLAPLAYHAAKSPRSSKSLPGNGFSRRQSAKMRRGINSHPAMDFPFVNGFFLPEGLSKADIHQ
jgi:hypothetical protein